MQKNDKCKDNVYFKGNFVSKVVCDTRFSEMSSFKCLSYNLNFKKQNKTKNIWKFLGLLYMKNIPVFGVTK